MPNIPAERLIRISTALFKAVGASDYEAERTSELLVKANLRGHDSHGVIRLPRYVPAIKDGSGATVGAKIEVVKETPTTALINGNRNLGQVSATKAMEIAIEKCVELGLNAFSPVITERSMKRDTVARLGRWKKIAVEAMKQSLRVYAPDVRQPVSFGDALREMENFERTLVAHRQAAGDAIGECCLHMRRGRLGLFIGPEGGFSEAEIKALRERGALMFSLGNVRLKSETAAIASVAIIRRSVQEAGGVGAV